LLRAVPALPVSDSKKSIDFYCNKLMFTLGHHEDGFVVLLYNNIRMLHLWEASDESWRTRNHSSPVVSGAESFIAGTASCRIEVEGIDDLYQQLLPLNIVHPNAEISDKWWGERDFGVIDPDNNLIEFFERKEIHAKISKKGS